MNGQPKAIRVLVADDSAFMRSSIKGMINADPELEVVATARDGREAIDRIEQYHPDVVTLDLEMPRMDGLTAIKTIMEKMPLPILVVSSLTTAAAKVTFDALELGAADYICKSVDSQVLNVMSIEQELRAKIKAIARQKVQHLAPSHQEKELPSLVLSRPDGLQHTHNVGIITIGVSTGGPKALQKVIPLLPRELPAPVLVVQHMPPMFTGPFAERLNDLSQLRVKEAANGDCVEPGMVYIARGGMHMRVHRCHAIDVRIELSLHPDTALYRPSVNVMILSAVEAYGGRCLGVIMTGMGNDGTEGIRAIKEHGGKSLVQDEESCIVYGMPKSVADAGLADKIVPLHQLAGEIINMV